ncbi:MAG: outer membrane lipoprotein carrier protein LolA [Deltaproteobacteria bacterium]|nr:MAG: outer membrane lipoprotein carrier protein LolA [Deltaproteobacteria bacterium]
MKKAYSTLSIVVIAIASYMFIGWADSWEQIKTGAKEIKSVKAEFVQEKHLKILLNPLVSKGVFYYQAPGSLRWEYMSPVRSILLMHNGKMKRYVKTSEGLVKDASANLQAMQIVVQEITMWLNGRFDDNPNFIAVLKQGRIILTPREKSLSMMIQRIELTLSNRPGVIKSVMIYENENSFTTLDFRNSRLNEKIEDSLFREVRSAN